MYAKKVEPIELPTVGHLHIHSAGYVYWENDGKYNREKGYSVDHRVPIGKLVDGSRTHFYPNSTYWQLFPDGKHTKTGALRMPGSPTIIPEEASKTIEAVKLSDEPNAFSITLAFGDYYVLRTAAEHIGCLRALQEVFPQEWEKIFAVSCHYILNSSMTAKNFPVWSFRHYSGLNLPIGDSEISRLYKTIGEDQDAIDSFMYFFRKYYCAAVYGTTKDEDAQSNLKHALFFAIDSSNHGTYSKNNNFSGFGKAKINEHLPIVNFALVVDEKTGIPVFHEIFHGSLLDKTQAPFTIEHMKRVGFVDFFAMIDRGYYCREVMYALWDVSFGMMCPSSAPIFQYMLNKYSSQIKGNPDYYILDEDVNGICEEGVTVYEKKCNAFLFYDPSRYEDERKDYESRLQSLLTKANERKKYTEKMVKLFSPQLIIKKLDKKDPITGKWFSVSENKAETCRVLAEAGFFVVISNRLNDPTVMIKAARKRDVCEKGFYHAKSHFDFNKPLIHSTTSYKGKMFCCFFSLIVMLSFFWYEQDFFKKNPRMSLNDLFGQLSQYEITRNNDGKWSPAYAVTRLMKDALKCLGTNQKEIECAARAVEIYEKKAGHVEPEEENDK